MPFMLEPNVAIKGLSLLLCICEVHVLFSAQKRAILGEELFSGMFWDSAFPEPTITSLYILSNTSFKSVLCLDSEKTYSFEYVLLSKVRNGYTRLSYFI